MSSTKQDIIKLPVPKNKLNKRLDFVISKGSNIVDYSGSHSVEKLFMLYMLKKYKSDCFIRYKKDLGEEEEEEKEKKKRGIYPLSFWFDIRSFKFPKTTSN